MPFKAKKDKCCNCQQFKLCIYLLEERKSGYFYIGKTKDFKKRKTQHLAGVKSGKHSNEQIRKFCLENKKKKQEWRMIKLIQLDNEVSQDFESLLENKMMFSYFVKRQGKCFNNIMMNKDLPTPESLFGTCLDELITKRFMDAVAKGFLKTAAIAPNESHVIQYLNQEADTQEERIKVHNLIKKYTNKT